MNLIDLRLQGFFSYLDEEIKFEEGINTIYGVDIQTEDTNGIGKSVIKEGITLASYGVCRVKSLDDAITWGQEKFIVTLQFEDKGKIYKIIRSKKREQSPKLQIFEDGEDISKTSLKAGQKYLNTLLGLEYEEFMRSHCFGQSKFDDLKNLTTTSFIELLKKLLGVDKYSQYQQKANQKKREFNDKITHFEGQLSLEEQVEEIVPFSFTKINVQNRVKRLQEGIFKYKKKKEDWQIIRNSFQKKMQHLEVLNSTLKRDIFSIGEQLIEGKCPTCKQEVTQKYLDKLKEKSQKRIVQLKEDLQKSEYLLVEVRDKIKETTVGINDWNNKLDKVNSIITKMQCRLKNQTIQPRRIDFGEIKKELVILKKKRSMVEGIEEIFSPKGFPLFILEQEMDELVLVINKYMSCLGSFRMDFQTEKELKGEKRLVSDCSIKIFRGHKECNLENLSGAQEHLVTLAIRLGLSEVFTKRWGKNMELLIIDEGFGKLSSLNARKVVNLLRKLEMTKIFKKILLITHSTEVREQIRGNQINLIYDGMYTKVGNI